MFSSRRLETYPGDVVLDMSVDHGQSLAEFRWGLRLGRRHASATRPEQLGAHADADHNIGVALIRDRSRASEEATA
jgi:hypothetical protein